jgi:hypothetical protein
MREDGGDSVDGGDSADSGTLVAVGDSCLGTARCGADAVCFQDRCALERDVSRFICDEDEPTQTTTVRLTMPVRDFVTEQPLPDLVVLACRENDVTCEHPLARFDDPDATGAVVLELPYAFAGYLEVSSPAVLTSLWYFTQPMLVDTDAKALKAVSAETVEVLAGITDIEVAENTGLVILEAFDCERNAVGGIQFEESKPGSMPFFIIDGLPNAESPVSIRNELDNQAAGGFVNATPGFTLFTARIGVEGPVLGTFNAYVRANTVTYLDIHP